MKQILVIFLVAGGSLFAQHNDFQSLYMYDALTVNPAYAGNKGALTFNANYRDQWSGIQGAPKTFSFTSHLLTRSKKIGLGFSAVNDRFGIQNDTRIKAIYAYKLKLGEAIWSFGAAAGIYNRSTDLTALNLVQQNDGTFLGQTRQSTVLDLAFGTMFKHKTFQLGLSVPNIARNKSENSVQAFNGYACYVFAGGKRLKFKPTTLIRYIVGSPLSYEGNLTVYYREELSFGAGLKSSKAANVYAQLQLNRQFAVAYLYERDFGQMGQLLKNTHEFMLNYVLDYKTNVQSPRYL